MSTTTDPITQFLSTFDSKPKGSPLSRAQHWLSVLQSPEQFADAYERRHRLTLAKQNLRRLLRRHPDLLPQLQNEAA